MKVETEFYKMFAILKEVFTEIIEQKLLPPTILQAVITVTHKKSKRFTKMRLIPPYKFALKLLQDVSKSHSSKYLIHQDQTIFIAG